ncbi:MAG TPA: hypothetical protein VI485_21720 [Vicinamibacterales bacterium]|nr:hypothetical protein [Vicinamibacterales bacterium]
MGRIVASTGFVFTVMLASAVAQTPGASGDQQYLLIDADTTRLGVPRPANLSSVREQLINAGKMGYGVHVMAGLSTSMTVLLKRDGAGPRNYRLITQSKDGAFLDELNTAGAEGFRVVADTIKEYQRGRFDTQWAAILAQQPNGRRFKYSVTKGVEEGARALEASGAVPRLLVGILGREGQIKSDTLLFFEEIEGTTAPSVIEARDYRIVMTARTSTMEKDIREAATEGYRIIGAGFGRMTVVMARDRNVASPPPIEYRVIATIRVKTSAEELQAAGTEGFRISAMTQEQSEGIFVIHRTPGTSEKFEFQVLRLEHETANAVLLDAESAGYRIAGLFSDLVVLERPVTR